MNKRIILATLLSALLGTAGCAAYFDDPHPHRHPPLRESEISVFYDELAPYGDWFWVEPWGWVWTPWHVERGWRPYTEGHWVHTALGWTWVSDWEWGWAPFHYGRWTHHPHHGWIWVPDTVWGPAWVAWRAGHGWIGWAPLPPGAHWRAGVGLDLGDMDLTLVIVDHGWSFVDHRHFLEPRIARRLEPPARNAYLLRDTEDRTRYVEIDRRPADRGLDVEEVERGVGQPVPRERYEDLEKAPQGRGSAEDRKAVPVERPETAKPKGEPDRKAAEKPRPEKKPAVTPEKPPAKEPEKKTGKKAEPKRPPQEKGGNHV